MRAFPKLIGCFVAVFAVCICVPGGLSAQGFGSINGTVTDSSGAVVAGAKSRPPRLATGISSKTTSGGAGQLRFPHSGAFGLQHQRHARRDLRPTRKMACKCAPMPRSR